MITDFGHVNFQEQVPVMTIHRACPECQALLQALCRIESFSTHDMHYFRFTDEETDA